MGSYIDSAKQNIRKISEEMHAMEARDMRYALVCYRDHPPQDSTYATKVFPFTPSIKEMQQNINTMSAQGGGDGPESVACALNEALNLDYRKNSVRICVVIADAPPHGLGESGDGFPDGCPCGYDPLVTARKMAENNIIIYSVACEPALGRYQNARGFFKGIAELSHGRYLSLGNAHLLPKVIVGGSAEELDLKKFEEQVVSETLTVKKETPALSSVEVEEKVWKNLQARGVNTWQLNVTHQTEKIANADLYFASPSLASAKAALPVAHQPAPSSRMTPTSGSVPPPVSYASQSASYCNAPISRDQVSRIMKKQ